ncbi:MAG: cation diffusion facilitator family transporter [Oligoflexia bacterium]
MGHSHDHPHPQGSHPSDSQRGLWLALGITGIFLVVEAIGGWFANSLALLSDAGHMLTDFGGLLLALFAGWVARRPPSRRLSYGYHRAEILGALASGLSIWALTGVLVFEAVARMDHPAQVQGSWVVGVASAGLVANLLSLKVLHRHQHAHLNVRGAYLHVLADLGGSLGALISGLLIQWKGWLWADPAMTFILAGLMLVGSWALIRDSVVVLMEATPSGMDSALVQEALAALPGVSEVHDLHIWSVGSGRMALSVHLISDRGEQVLEAANRLLEQQFAIAHTTIQVEHPERFQSSRCYDCSH